MEEAAVIRNENDNPFCNEGCPLDEEGPGVGRAIPFYFKNERRESRTKGREKKMFPLKK